MEDNLTIKSYYQTTELFLPEYPQWRFFMFLIKGKMKRFHIKTKEELRHLLLKYLPEKVYFSSGVWLNVRNVRGKIKTKTYPIFLYEDTIFDIDSENIDEAVKHSLELINKLGPPDKIVNTKRGFHIWYLKRKNKQELIKLAEGIKDVDIKCTKNLYNVFALPLTFKNNHLCKFITLQELHNLYDGKDTSKMGINPNETSERNLRSDVSEKMQSKINNSGMGVEGTIQSFNNQVKPNIFIPILIYEKNYKKTKLELERLNLQYNLGDLYCFKSDKFYAFISLRCFEKRQLQKVLNSSNSISKQSFKKFNKIWLDISNYEFVGRIRFKTNKFFRASRKHYNFINSYNKIELRKVDEFVGHPQLKIYEVHKT